MKRLGPDLKMPDLKMRDLKVPPFLGDLLYDLRDRRLLAPIALVVVAIAAVPFLLGGDAPEPAPTPAGIGATVPTPPPTLTVVEARPGLRDYHQRLAGRRPTNPFVQRYTGAAGGGAEPGSASGSKATKASPAEGAKPGGETSSGGASSAGEANSATPSAPSTPSSPSAPSAPPASTTPSSDGPPRHHIVFFTWAINVWISKAPGKDTAPDAEPEVNAKEKVLAQAPLPGPKAPVVTYLGLSRAEAAKHVQKALFLVSNDVSKVEGAKCAFGGGRCQLVEAKPGLPITFVYGVNETRYTIKVLKIELVVTGHS